jgi:hypothetical protein
MSSILTRKDRAASPTSSSSLSAPVKTCALAFIEQSNGAGQTTRTRTDTTPVFYNAPAQGLFEPFDTTPEGRGSYMLPALQALAVTDNVRVKFGNFSLSGQSFIKQACGRALAWAAGRDVYAERITPLGSGDPGYRGDHIVESGKWFKCTVGARALGFLNEPKGVAFNGAIVYTQNIVALEGTGTAGYPSFNMKTGGTLPAGFATATVGQTVTDGPISWLCVSTTADTAFDSGLRVLRPGDPGFDPFFVLQRARDWLLAQTWAIGKKYVWIANGQSDAGTLGSWYLDALTMMGRYFMSYGITPIFGFSVYGPQTPNIGGAPAAWRALGQIIHGGPSGAPGTAMDPDNLLGSVWTLTYKLNATVGVSGSWPTGSPNYGLPAKPGVRAGQWYLGTSLHRVLGEFPANTNTYLQSDDLHFTDVGVQIAWPEIYKDLKAIILDQNVPLTL